MIRALLLVPATLAAACATAPAPYRPAVRDIAYQAIGSRTFWLLTIGDDRILFYPMSGNRERRWPRVLPRTEGGARIWETSDAQGAIRIEARPGPCAADDESLYEDFVTLRMGEDGPELGGCGGRRLGRDRP